MKPHIVIERAWRSGDYRHWNIKYDGKPMRFRYGGVLEAVGTPMRHAFARQILQQLLLPER